MSRRRNTTEGPLSLFSFQDIITGISGIMIVVVLMLVLEVLNRKVNERPAVLPHASVLAKLRQDIAALRSKTELLRGEFDQSQHAIDVLSRITFDQIPEDLEREKSRRRRLQAQIAKVTSDLAALRQNAQKTERANEYTTRRLAKLQKELEELEKQTPRNGGENRIFFVTSQRTHKKPILVECSRSGIKARVLGEVGSVRSFIDPRSSHYQSSISEFSKWAHGRNVLRDAFVVLVKPSACGYGPNVVGMLQEAGFDVGFEPLEEEKTAIFEDKPEL